MKRWDAAALFGIALAKRATRWTCTPTLRARQVADGVQGHEGCGCAGRDAVLAAAGLQHRWWHPDGSGLSRPPTRATTGSSSSPTSRPTHAGVYGVDKGVPADKHFFTFNLAGYRRAHAPTGKTRHAFGGLTDACFPLISMIEEGTSGRWPWEGVGMKDGKTLIALEDLAVSPRSPRSSAGRRGGWTDPSGGPSFPRPAWSPRLGRIWDAQEITAWADRNGYGNPEAPEPKVRRLSRRLTLPAPCTGCLADGC